MTFRDWLNLLARPWVAISTVLAAILFVIVYFFGAALKKMIVSAIEGGIKKHTRPVWSRIKNAGLALRGRPLAEIKPKRPAFHDQNKDTFEGMLVRWEWDEGALKPEPSKVKVIGFFCLNCKLRLDVEEFPPGAPTRVTIFRCQPCNFCVQLSGRYRDVLSAVVYRIEQSAWAILDNDA